MQIEFWIVYHCHTVTVQRRIFSGESSLLVFSISSQAFFFTRFWQYSDNKGVKHLLLPATEDTLPALGVFVTSGARSKWLASVEGLELLHLAGGFAPCVTLTALQDLCGSCIKHLMLCSGGRQLLAGWGKIPAEKDTQKKTRRVGAGWMQRDWRRYR